MYKYFKELSEEYQHALNKQLRDRYMKTRKLIIAKYGVEKADDLWYTRKDYIDNQKYSDDALITCCPHCGRPDNLNEGIEDRPGSYQSRNVTYRCTSCGKYYKVNC